MHPVDCGEKWICLYQHSARTILRILNGKLIKDSHQFLSNSWTKDRYLEIRTSDKNQVDDKIEWGLGGGFLSFTGR